MRGRTIMLAGLATALLVALGVGQAALQAATDAQTVKAPRFEVDPYWPKPLPNHWVLGSAIGVGIDSRDHVFIIHRGDSTLNQRTDVGADANPPIGECCRSAPPILEFDPAGNLVKAWGGPGEGYEWPLSNHGITIDNKDNVWIGGNGVGDSHILKFTHDGKFLMQIGTPKQQVDSKALNHFGRVAKISFDVGANEAFVADGYGNHRVAVIDMTSGKIKRIWGAYGNVPSDTNLGRYTPGTALAQQFRTPVHCAEPTNDGLVYVCDRPNDRIQVFKKDGSFVKEKIIAPLTRGDGSVWDIAFSRDAAQKYIYLADGKNEHVYVMDRQSLDIITQFGDGGRQAGQFFAVHSIATDTKGNLYTTETYEGKRLQKFVYKGLGDVSREQGVPWRKP
jgi:DNA-binding beta-propeller fold protein YncE